nr:unknown [Zea mays]
MRRIVGAENETIAELMKICTSKLKLLASASASLSLVLH